ncbi:MAG: hypothetical protein V9G04_17080 [Nocardioides sp.]|jgi:hypothetical protein
MTATLLVLETRIADLIANMPGLSVTVRFQQAPQAAVVLSAAVVDALADATGEALRNVQRHSGVREAEIVIDRRGRGVRLEVRDRGTSAAHAVEGFGIGSSIRERLEDVGGIGTVDFGPRGTTVRLQWPSPGRQSLQAELDQALEGSRAASGSARTIPSIGVIVLLAQLYLAARHIPSGEHILIQTGIVAVLSGAMIWVVRLTDGGTLRLWQFALISQLCPALALWGVWLNGEGALTDFRSWQVGFVATVLTLLAFFVPPRLVVWLVVPLPVGTALLTWWDPTVTAWESAGAWNSYSFPLVGGLFGFLLRWAYERVNDQRRALAAARVDEARVTLLQAARERHLARTEREIVPWLRSIGEGAGAIDEVVREKAALLGASARDDLYVPEVFDDRLRGLANDFRRRGGRLDVRPGTGADGHAEQASRTIATLLLCVAHAERVIITPSDLGGLRAVINPGLDPEQIGELLRVLPRPSQLESDEFSTVLLWHEMP